MQEAVTNVLKHSGGDALAVIIRRQDATGEPIRISIRDNGKGMHGMTVAGHGLDNMRARAAAIGATIFHESSDQGVTVNLDLPASLSNPQ
jgi:two-component system sensor histidine kinase UhpB